MPLHLLGKKSWNVYNADNIAKVRRDEAKAKAQEEEEERRMQEVDAQRRIQILRGEQPGAPPSAPSDDERLRPDRQRKRKRIAGEDDTERDIRLAKDSSALSSTDTALQIPGSRKPTSDAPLTDHAGHINLFPDERSRRHVAKNQEAEAEAAKKKREFEDQYTMRFSNAAGFKQGLENPWYSSSTAPTKRDDDEDEDDEVGKDVWGNEDRGRKEREKKRIEAGDPLMSMRRGVRDLRQVEKERRQRAAERAREMKELERAARSSRRSRRRDDDQDDPPPLSLDGSTRRRHHERDWPHHSQARSRHRRYHRERTRSREGSSTPSKELKDDNDGIAKDTVSLSKHRRRRHSSSNHESRRVSKSNSLGGSETRKPHKHDADEKPGWERGVGGRYSNQFVQT